MTPEELKKGYVDEVDYQKHMLRNLQYWFQLFLMLGAIGVVLIYYFVNKTTWLFILGIILVVVGLIGMLLFGYGQKAGRKNVNLIIDDYQKKVEYFDQEVKHANKIK